MRRFSLVLAIGCLVDCAASPYLMPESESQAPGEAQVDFSLRKPMPDHRPVRQFEFYYKHCTVGKINDVFPTHGYECNAY